MNKLKEGDYISSFNLAYILQESTFMYHQEINLNSKQKIDYFFQQIINSKLEFNGLKISKDYHVYFANKFIDTIDYTTRYMSEKIYMAVASTIPDIFFQLEHQLGYEEISYAGIMVLGKTKNPKIINYILTDLINDLPSGYLEEIIIENLNVLNISNIVLKTGIDNNRHKLNRIIIKCLNIDPDVYPSDKEFVKAMIIYYAANNVDTDINISEASYLKKWISITDLINSTSLDILLDQSEYSDVFNTVKLLNLGLDQIHHLIKNETNRSMREIELLIS